MLEAFATTKENEWTPMVHNTRFKGDEPLVDLYLPRSRDLDWIPTTKTTGEALRTVKGVGPGKGLEAYRKLHLRYAKTKMQNAVLKMAPIANVKFQEESFETTLSEWEVRCAN